MVVLAEEPIAGDGETLRAALLIGAGEFARTHRDHVVLELRRDPDPTVAQAAVPGALLATLSEHFAAPPSPLAGGHPLPDEAALRGTLARWGIGVDTPVIVYPADVAEVTIATRAWFVLRLAGIRSVRLLDGGLPAYRQWRAEHADDGGRAPAPSARRLPDLPPVAAIGADEAAALAASGVLLDARQAEVYRGTDGGKDTGHIPGAVSAPASELFEAGRLLAEADLRRWAAGHGVGTGAPVGAYCGRGVAASGTVFALASIGVAVPLYVGSWSAWSNDPGRPVARGEDKKNG